jgi:hypothetical protein
MPQGVYHVDSVGGLFQEDEMKSIGLRDDNLQYFLQRTRTAPDCCAVKDDTVSLCATCSSAIAKRAIPPLSAGNFVNCLFCQDYPEALKNLNTVQEAFIARANVLPSPHMASSLDSDITFDMAKDRITNFLIFEICIPFYMAQASMDINKQAQLRETDSRVTA